MRADRPIAAGPGRAGRAACAGRRGAPGLAHTPCGQRGQALVETLVIALAMLPLLVGVVAIGKLLDARQAAIAASRAVAFECTVRLHECRDASGRAELARQMRARLFARDERLATAAEVDEAATPVGRVGWTDRAGRPMLGSAADVSVDIGPRRLDAPRSNLRDAPAAIAQGGLRLIDGLAGPSRFGLETWDGLQAAQVGIGLRADDLGTRGAPVGSLRMQARTAVLADAWTASGPRGDPDSVHDRVEAGWRIDALEPVLDVGYAGVRGLMFALHALGMEPAAGSYRHHWVDVDIVPADRREAAGTTAGRRDAADGAVGRQSGRDASAGQQDASGVTAASGDAP